MRNPISFLLSIFIAAACVIPLAATPAFAQSEDIRARFFKAAANNNDFSLESEIEFRGERLRVGSVAIEYKSDMQTELSEEDVLAGLKKLNVRKINFEFQFADLKPTDDANKKTAMIVSKIIYVKGDSSSRALGKCNIELIGDTSLQAKDPKLKIRWKVETGDTARLKSERGSLLSETGQLIFRDSGEIELDPKPE